MRKAVTTIICAAVAALAAPAPTSAERFTCRHFHSRWRVQYDERIIELAYVRMYLALRRSGLEGGDGLLEQFRCEASPPPAEEAAAGD